MSTAAEMRQQLKDLAKERAELESKIVDMQTVERTAMGSYGAGARLVDEEGFPRADIDVYQVREVRHDLVRAQNDHKALCERITKLMYAMHEQAKKELEDKA